jgi:hypothetical protein
MKMMLTMVSGIPNGAKKERQHPNITFRAVTLRSKRGKD